MSDTSDADESDELAEIKRRKKEKLEAQATQSGDPVYVDGKTHLQELVAENGVVLVDFYADWCGPCQMLEPVVESIAADTPATVAKVDVDAYQSLAREYDVQGIPALFLFVDGEVAERLVGMQDEQTLFSLVEQHV